MNRVTLNLLYSSAQRNQLLWGFGDESCMQMIIQTCHLSDVHSVSHFLNPFSCGVSFHRLSLNARMLLCTLQESVSFLLLAFKIALDKFTGNSLVLI